MKKCLDPDPGSEMRKWLDPDPGSGIKHPGSATLHPPFQYGIGTKKYSQNENNTIFYFRNWNNDFQTHIHYLGIVAAFVGPGLGPLKMVWIMDMPTPLIDKVLICDGPSKNVDVPVLRKSAKSFWTIVWIHLNYVTGISYLGRTKEKTYLELRSQPTISSTLSMLRKERRIRAVF
jgi:hypothetical protein